VPINPEHRRYYGRAFRRIRLALIEEAGGEICSKCGIELAQGINGAHQDHDPKNPESVILMCPACHARHDAPHRIAIMRRRKAKSDGQLWLTPEFEWAPFASWEIPPAVYDIMRQLSLFHDPRVS
jgi:RNase P subunit RPR2